MPRDNKPRRAARKTAGKPGTSIPESFAIVGIGASAGGLDAMTRLLQALPDDTGMAFVIVSHLSATHESLLAEILSRRSAMPVVEVQDTPTVQPNHVYVIPPARTMIINQRRLQLFPRKEPDGLHHPIDVFLQSLASEQGHRSIGVILSGTATDGTLGLEEIKAAGGITFAQDASAQHDGMPKSAIATGCVDFVLPPDEIAAELVRIGSHSHFTEAHPPTAPSQSAADQQRIERIVQLLEKTVGVDFSGYKQSTLYRRITRRMALQKQAGIAEYLKLLQKDRSELELLYRDILINVTAFFRDPEAFDALKAEVFPRLVADRAVNDPIRVWVVGCSTGEEAYSLAIALTEFLDPPGQKFPVQIFASDVNEAGIERGRAGSYLHGIANNVSPERLRRFFSETGDGYRVNKSLRDLCIFAKHNGLTDPPFSRIDLISCRNMMIYLDAELQQKLIPLLHYALKPNGFLWLGSSETIGRSRDLFDVGNARQRIYLKKPLAAAARPRLSWNTALLKPQGDSKRGRARGRAATPFDVHREAERVLLGRYTPPGVLVNGDHDILQFRGDTSPYLMPTPGKASLNLLKMLRDGLLIPVRAALTRARKQQMPVREEGVTFTSSEGRQAVNIEVTPVRGPGPAEEGFLVVFEPVSAARKSAAPVSSAKRAAGRVETPAETERLRHELAATKDYLQAVIEQQEASNEELQSANEEVQSSNEELQSVNEELETSKEEIQSSNEELSTVNDELQTRNQELADNHNDMLNLLASAELAIVMLGPDLSIRRFTPAAEHLLNLIAGDVGRPIGNIKLNVDLPDLEAMVKHVIATVTPQMREVQDIHGCWFSVRVQPYRTAENKVAGAVLMLVDVDSLKRAEESVRESEARFRLLADSAPVLIWVDDADENRFVNRAYLEFVGAAEYAARSERWQEFIHPDDRDSYLARYREAAARNEPFEAQVRFCRADGQYRWMKSIAQPRNSDQFGGFVGSMTDVSDLKEAELALLNADRNKNEFLAILSHELRNPLAPLRNVVQLLRTKGADEQTLDWSLETLDRQIRNLTLLVNDLLDISRITHGKINLRREQLDVLSAVHSAEQMLEPAISARRQVLTTDLPPQPIWVMADRLRLEQVFGNLLHNASKFTAEHGRIWLSAKEVPGGGAVEVRVRDDGSGISAEALPGIFELFTQGDRSIDRAHGGLGIGLTVVRRLVQLHGGEVIASSAGLGAGSEFVVRLPTVLAGAAAADAPKPLNPDARTAAIGPVLLVDDNLDARDTLAQLLRTRGYQVELASDGPGAFELVREKRVQAVLLDIGLPGRDGYEVARELRKEPALNGATLIAVTGYGGPDERYRAREAGFDHYLTKPVDLDVLVELLAQA